MAPAHTAPMNNGEAKYTTIYSRLQKQKKEMERFDLHYGFFGGYYSPRKSFSQFGNKGNLGGTIGFDWNRVICDLSLLFQFGKSKKPYTIIYEDEPFETDNYFRFYCLNFFRLESGCALE